MALIEKTEIKVSRADLAKLLIGDYAARDRLRIQVDRLRPQLYFHAIPVRGGEVIVEVEWLDWLLSDEGMDYADPDRGYI